MNSAIQAPLRFVGIQPLRCVAAALVVLHDSLEQLGKHLPQTRLLEGLTRAGSLRRRYFVYNRIHYDEFDKEHNDDAHKRSLNIYKA